jgi:signal peptidase I
LFSERVAMASTLKKLWRNEYFKTAVAIIAIVAFVFGFWFGAQTVLGTPYPALAVASGSMCKIQPNACDGWSHPFDRTLHKGDLIIIQAVSPESINAAPEPYGDIIVYRRQSDGELIVHRAIAKETVGGKIFFTTKGDANGEADSPTVPQENVVGRVILHIPWIGWVALFMRDSSVIYIIMVVIILLVIVEFAVSALKNRTETEKTLENADKID